MKTASTRFWIDYTMPCESVVSSLPVAIIDGELVFCDGAYDAFDFYVRPCEKALEDMTEEDEIAESADYDAWCGLLCEAGLTLNAHGDTARFLFQGHEFIITRNDNRDNHGSEF